MLCFLCCFILVSGKASCVFPSVSFDMTTLFQSFASFYYQPDLLAHLREVWIDYKNVYLSSCSQALFCINFLSTVKHLHCLVDLYGQSFDYLLNFLINYLTQCYGLYRNVYLILLTLSMPHATIVALSRLVQKVPLLELLHATKFSVRLVW